MNEPKFTPGPWKVDYDGTKGHIKSIAPHEDGDTPTICRYDIFQDFHGSPYFWRQKYNAALIAAAPKMYAYIKEMAERYGNSEWIAGEAKKILDKINQP